MAERAGIPAVRAAAAPASGVSPPPLPIGMVLAKKPEKRQPGPKGRR